MHPYRWLVFLQTRYQRASSADEFLDAALVWFGDPDPRIGTAWEKGERLAKLIAHRKTLLVLDGLEPLQNPPGPTDLSPTEWRTILAKLRRARLLAEEDPYNPGPLDTHPLIREYYGEQLRSQLTESWKESSRRLYQYYRTLAPRLPDSFKEMEPLFLAVICGCNAGLYREALREVYIPRIQRGNTYFAANVLGAREALLSVLVHFFEHGRWESPVEMGVEEQSLTAEDQLFILMQAAQYLTATRGLGAPEARICCERAEPLCHSLNRPLLLYVALTGQWRYSWMTDKLTTSLQIAERVFSLAQAQNDAALLIGAYRALSGTLYRCRRGQNRYLVLGSHPHGKGAKVDFTDETAEATMQNIAAKRREP